MSLLSHRSNMEVGSVLTSLVKMATGQVKRENATAEAHRSDRCFLLPSLPVLH